MSSPKGLISPTEAKSLNNAYTSRHELISKDITKRPDNRSTWFALEDIEKFLTYAKAQAAELGYEMDGIRIYCGAYEPKKEQAGYSTSFIIPTATNEVGEEGGVESHDITDANGLNKGSNGKPPSATYPQ